MAGLAEAIATGRPLGIQSAVTSDLSFYRLPDFVHLDRLSFSSVSVSRSPPPPSTTELECDMD